MKLNKDTLLTLIEDGYIMVNTNQDESLMILNYTRKTQFEKYWNEYTLMARGLIIDREYNVVAIPFPKFFNYEEHKAEEIPRTSFEVYDKMDGSLGILFYYRDGWKIATRGSFVSDQAIRAAKILEQYDLDTLEMHSTYLFEIIYPENRIVVDYNGEEKLVLLGITNTTKGYLIDYTYDDMFEHMAFGNRPKFEIVKRYNGVNSIKELKARNILNQEGYVLRYANGFRMKVKFEDYCRLHSIITNISTKDIWECLRDEKDINELLDRTPDEFDEWVRGEVNKLNEDFTRVEKNCKSLFNCIYTEGISKKDFAGKALLFKESAILFRMFEGKSYDNIIWKLVEPKWSKPFFKQDDEE
jgi:RNA ligase